jgi:hypothetical protein
MLPASWCGEVRSPRQARAGRSRLTAGQSAVRGQPCDTRLSSSTPQTRRATCEMLALTVPFRVWLIKFQANLIIPAGGHFRRSPRRLRSQWTVPPTDLGLAGLLLVALVQAVEEFAE